MPKNRKPYQAEVSDKLQWWMVQVGHNYKMAGIVFEGPGDNRVALFPWAELRLPVTNTYHTLSAEEWAALLKIADDPAYLGAETKAWHRKAERVIGGFVQQQIWARDRFQCPFTRKGMGKELLTVDHWMPLALGGENKPSNYITMNRSLNKQKGDMHPDEFCEKFGYDGKVVADYLSGRIIVNQLWGGIRKISP